MGADASVGAAAGAAVATVAGAEPPRAATAVRQFGESCAELRCRQRSASAPPGCTPEQRDMKSDWQDWRMAACCCGVGCRNAAGGAAAAAGAVAARTGGCGAGAGALGGAAAAGAGIAVAAGRAAAGG